VADKSVQTALNIAVLLLQSKIMTTSVNELTIDDMEKAIILQSISTKPVIIENIMVKSDFKLQCFSLEVI